MKLLLSYFLLLIAFPQAMMTGVQENIEDDPQRIRSLGTIAMGCFNHNEYEKAKPYADEIVRLAETSDDPYAKTLAAYCKIVYLTKENDITSVSSCLLEADSLMETLPDDDESNYLRYLMNIRFFYYYYTIFLAFFSNFLFYLFFLASFYLFLFLFYPKYYQLENN